MVDSRQYAQSILSCIQILCPSYAQFSFKNIITEDQMLLYPYFSPEPAKDFLVLYQF
jgi:hypothetical protein